MSRERAWWVYLWIPIILLLSFPPLSPVYAGGLAAYHVVRGVWGCFVRDAREVRAGRRSGLWRAGVFGGVVLLSGSVALAAYLGGKDAAERASSMAGMGIGLSVVLGPPLWWVFSPLARYLRRRNRHAVGRPPVLTPLNASPDDSQPRRVAARRRALLDYSLYSPRLGSRFTRAMFDQYVAAYMGDGVEADDVERSGRELLAVLDRHASCAEPPKKERTIEGLTGWYRTQKSQIESAEIDERIRGTQMGLLNERYAELVSQLMETMEP